MVVRLIWPVAEWALGSKMIWEGEMMEMVMKLKTRVMAWVTMMERGQDCQKSKVIS